MASPFAREVHGPERMLEPRMLGRGENPPRALQLVYASQTLQPRSVDQVLLGRLAGDPTRASTRDAKVSVDGVGRQVDARVLGAGLVHAAIIAGHRAVQQRALL